MRGGSFSNSPVLENGVKSRFTLETAQASSILPYSGDTALKRVNGPSFSA